MIDIRETSPPYKLSGLSSFLVSFKYNEAVVNAVKMIGGCIYHKKQQVWEVPCNKLTALCDTLTFLDDIHLHLIPDPEIEEISSEGNLTDFEISQFRFKPFRHQIDGINYMLTQRNKMLLLDAPGVGKTIQIIGFAETLKRRGLIDHCLIVCGVNSIKLNWERELKQFSTESCRIIGKKVTKTGSIRYTSVKERIAELTGPLEEFFIIVNIETLRNDSVIEAISKSANKFGLIAVDEIHRAGNTTSEQGHNLLKLQAPYKIAATGTLITNSALSAYGPLKFIEKEKATLTNYKGMYLRFGGFNGYQVVGQQNLDVLQEEIKDCSLRRTLEEVREDIPDLQIKMEVVEPEEEDIKFYEAIKAGVREEADKIKLTANNLLALTIRLRQATACPSILTSQPVQSTKLLRCKELVEEILDSGEKVVVFSTFKPPVYELAKMLEGRQVLVNTGDMPADEINRNVNTFRDTAEPQVFLATGSLMGTGHNLNSAMYLIFIDTPWTWSEFDQQFSRVYRVNNTRPAFVKVLATAGTIDERVWEIVNRKKNTADYLVDGKVSDEMMEDLKSIIFE